MNSMSLLAPMLGPSNDTFRPALNDDRLATRGARVGAVTTPTTTGAPSKGFFDDVSLWTIVGWVGGGLGAYHGYKRNGGSIGWALGWSILGSFLPIIAIPVMFAQGFGQRRGR